MKRLLIALGCMLIVLPALAQATSSLPPPTNIRITNHPFLQNEEQVWMCDTDSAVIVANWRDFALGYRQIGVGRSTDGGQTWSYGLIPNFDQYFGPLSWQSDPTLTGDQYGNFIETALDFINAGGDSTSTISVYRSTDKGETWIGPVPAVIPSPGDIFEDKQFTTIDRTGGTYDGNFYMAWARFPNPDQIMFVRSTDGGASFDLPVVIGPNQTSTGCGSQIVDAGQFANVMVHESGDVHAFWVGFALDSGGTCTGTQTIKHVASSDGGQTFTYEDTVLSVSGGANIDGGIAVYSQPACDADLTGGPFSGNMYIAFGNSGPEDGSGVYDVDFIRSTDNGASWSERITINDDDLPQVDNFHPWLIVNEDGVIISIFYDQRLDPSHFLFDLFASYSYDGGLTFTTNHRLSSASSSPNSLKHGYEIPNFPWWEQQDLPEGEDAPVRVDPQAGLLGEYIGVTGNYDKLNAVWTDSRDGNSEIYTTNWYLPMLEPRLMAPADGDYTQASPSFAWATSWKNNEDRYRLEISDDQSFATITETRVIDTNLYTLDASLPDGIYYWRVKTFNTAETDSTDYSPVWQFEVDGTEPAPLTLISPYDGKVEVEPAGPFTWTTALKSASPVTYDFYIVLDKTQPEVFTQMAAGLTQPMYVLTELLVGGGAAPHRWYVTAVDEAGNQAVSDTFSLSISCCRGETGDVNSDGNRTLTDLTQLVNYLFVTFQPPACLPAANMNGDPQCVITLTDLTRLVNKQFVTFFPCAPCDSFDNTLCY